MKQTILAAALLMLCGCSAALYTPTLTEISNGPQENMRLPSDANLWV